MCDNQKVPRFTREKPGLQKSTHIITQKNVIVHKMKTPQNLSSKHTSLLLPKLFNKIERDDLNLGSTNNMKADTRSTLKWRIQTEGDSGYNDEEILDKRISTTFVFPKTIKAFSQIFPTRFSNRVRSSSHDCLPVLPHSSRTNLGEFLFPTKTKLPEEPKFLLKKPLKNIETHTIEPKNGYVNIKDLINEQYKKPSHRKFILSRNQVEFIEVEPLIQQDYNSRINDQKKKQILERKEFLAYVQEQKRVKLKTKTRFKSQQAIVDKLFNIQKL